MMAVLPVECSSCLSFQRPGTGHEGRSVSASVSSLAT